MCENVRKCEMKRNTSFVISFKSGFWPNVRTNTVIINSFSSVWIPHLFCLQLSFDIRSTCLYVQLNSSRLSMMYTHTYVFICVYYTLSIWLIFSLFRPSWLIYFSYYNLLNLFNFVVLYLKFNNVLWFNQKTRSGE